MDFEVYSATGQKVWQTWQDDKQLTGQAQTYRASWGVPASQARGIYYFKIGVFSVGWGTLYGWNNGAATLTVGAASVPIQNFPCTVTIDGVQRTGTCSGTFSGG